MTVYGICNLSLIALRAEPSHRSEMTSQVLFGDCFEILDEQKSWSLIKLAQDNYEGWVDTKQITYINFDLYKEVTHHVQAISDLSSHGILMRLGHDEMLHILPGSTLPLLQEDGLFTIGETDYMFLGLSINRACRKINWDHWFWYYRTAGSRYRNCIRNKYYCTKQNKNRSVEPQEF